MIPAWLALPICLALNVPGICAGVILLARLRGVTWEPPKTKKF